MDSGIRVNDCFKRWGDRTGPPAETIRWARGRLQSPEGHLFRGTDRMDRGRLDIPVFVSHCGPDAIRLLGRAFQMGRGATPEQAEASALMGLLERLALARFTQASATAWRPLERLNGPHISLEALAHSVGDDKTDLDQVAGLFRTVPMHWVPALSLVDHRSVWVPFDWFYRIHETNGAAAGNTLEEAMVQGTCELVERHVASRVVQQRLDTPWIRNATIDDTEAKELTGKMTRAGIKLHLKDFSLDTGIPTVGLVAYDPATFPEGSELVFTAGTATSPEAAAIRAITEAAQLAGDFLYKTHYQPTLPRYESLNDARYLLDTTTRTDLAALPNLADDNLRVEIERLTARLDAQGLALHAVDIGDKELEVPAVYMIAPGAQLSNRTRSDTVLFHFARLVALAPDPSGAQVWTRRLAEAFPDRFEPLFFAAYALERNGLFAEALPGFRKALDADPDPIHVTSIYAHIGECLKQTGDIDGAIRTLLAATSQRNAHKEAFQVLGQCYFMRGAYYKAIEAFGQAILRDPNSALDYANLAACLREMGHGDDAIRMYDTALKLDPTLDQARIHRARLLAMRDDGKDE